jgi:ferredoxin-NADP reductase
LIFETRFSEIIPRTPIVTSFRFEKPGEMTYRAGQFMFVTIDTGKGKLRKHFSISSSPTEDYLEFTKKLTQSDFSQALREIQGGDWANVEAPYGAFFLDPSSRKIGMLSGGIGITPLRSMIKYSIDMDLDIDIALIYSCKTQRDIVFKEELDEFRKEVNINIIYTLTKAGEEWGGEGGRINQGMVERRIEDYMKRLFYICGPVEMVNSMINLLRNMNFPEEKIRIEYFPFPNPR